jgi:pentatricopeptide repeat protein
LADAMRRSVRLAGTGSQRAEAVFTFLHERILFGGYDLRSTDVRRVLDDGRFNCVSATVLFNYLAGQAGLDCRGLEMPGHAMSRIVALDAPLDIETTCPDWFHLKDNPPRPAIEPTEMIGAASSADRSKAREVSPIQLAAMIYYNRGVDLLAGGRFSPAAAANAKALRLDPTNAVARGNLLATINNWSIALGDAGHYTEAIGLLRQGLAMDRNFSAFAQNFVHVHRQWIDTLCRDGRFDEAMAVLDRAAAELPGCNFFVNVRRDVQQRRQFGR